MLHHVHELCRFAAHQLGRTSEHEKGKRWYTSLSHRAFHDAIQKNLMESYDVLIIDEGQVFHKGWLTDLEQWFTSKPILLCCDETQSFAYEHKTPADEIAKLINAPSPFTLTYNMRSPRPVFDRLQQVITLNYEQQSQRDDEPDTLQEILNTDPLWQLHQVIEQLHKDNIPPEHIMVIYWNTAPTYQDGFEQLVGRSISVYKCRGIEAPVVILWLSSSDTIDDITWACAYSRATSRCIAIYHLAALLKHHNDHQFAQVLVSGDTRLSQLALQQQEKERQQQELYELQKKEMREQHGMWPSPSWQLLTFANQVLQWSYLWQAWYLQKQPTQIETLLWAMHVAMISPYEVYAEGKFYGGEYLIEYRYMRKFIPSTNVIMIPQHDIPIVWCKKCQSWSRGHIIDNIDTTKWHCCDCLIETSNDVGKEVESSLMRSAQQIVMEYDTVFSMALFYWSELSPAQKEPVGEHCHNTKNPLNWVARIITATEILALYPGTLIETETIQHLSWNGCPWLTTQINKTQWFEALALGMKLWARYKAVQRKTKGVYEVLDLGLNNDE